MPSVVLHYTKKVTICRRLKNITNNFFFLASHRKCRKQEKNTAD